MTQHKPKTFFFGGGGGNRIIEKKKHLEEKRFLKAFNELSSKLSKPDS